MQARLAVLALIRVIGPFLLLAAAPLFVLVGIGWGAFYAQWVEPRVHLPDWLSGLCFALLPLSVAVVVVLPVLDGARSEEHTSELQSRGHLVCRLLLEKKN